MKKIVLSNLHNKTTSELADILKTLQPTLRWDFAKMQKDDLIETIRLHFSDGPRW